MRRNIAFVSTLAVALVVAASGAAALFAQPAPGPTKKPTSSDMGRAAAATLRATDVYPNFVRTTNPTAFPTIAHCGGYPGNRANITVTGEARSAFGFGSHSIASTVLWFKTVADANRYWTATVREQYVSCRAKGLRLTNAAGDVIEPYITQAAQIELRPTGAEKAVAYRVIGGVPSTPGPGNDSYNWIDTNVFVKQGRSVGMLRTVWITDPCDCYHKLSRALATRMKAAARTG
jgi:hypothetical protein